MSEAVKEIIAYVAPLVAGFITSVLIPTIIEKVVMKRLQSKIDEVNSGAEFKELKKELAEVKKEVLLLRGKRKWRNTLYGI